MTRPWVLHVDLDQFLAAVEVLRRPELAGRPVVVGGRGDRTERGVVSTASYEAREHGVRSGMPLRTAARRCPDAVFLPVDADAYHEVSARVMETLRSFDVATDALWGIGSKTARRLAALGIETVGQLAAADPRRLAAELGPTMGPWYRRLGRGADSSPVEGTPWVARSHGRESTFQRDLTDPVAIEAEVRRLAGRVVDDVRRDGRRATRVGVKVRFAPFDTHTRSRALDEPTVDVPTVTGTALTLVDALLDDRPVRLLGVRAEMEPPG